VIEPWGLGEQYRTASSSLQCNGFYGVMARETCAPACAATGEPLCPSMLPLLYARENVVIFDRSFDAETTAIIGKAFDKACEEMHDKTQPGWFRERVAKRLIEIAARGERDPETMCESALISLGLVPNRFTIRCPKFRPQCAIMPIRLPVAFLQSHDKTRPCQEKASRWPTRD
jgi:hypothetical protein